MLALRCSSSSASLRTLVRGRSVVTRLLSTEAAAKEPPRPAALTVFDVTRLKKYAKSSKEAHRMLRAKMLFDSSVESLKTKPEECITLLDLAVRKSESVVFFTKENEIHFQELFTLARDANGPDTALARAVLLMCSGMKHEAVLELETVISADQAASFRLRGCLRPMTDLPQAILDFTAALEHGGHHENLFQRAHSKLNSQDLVGAEADYRSFIKLCAGDERMHCEAFYHLGILEIIKEGTLKNAEALYEEGLDAAKKRCPIYDDPPSGMRKKLGDYIANNKQQ